jgi:undecaprenyl-diphosphatase
MVDQFFVFISFLGNYAIVWFALAVTIATRQTKRAKMIILDTFTALAFSFLITTVLKLLFRLPRPSYQLPATNYCPSDFSFPSGHASTSFAAAVVLARFDPKRKWIYFALAGLISYSRIYLSCHHLADVIVGAILGVLVAKLTLSR